MNIYELAGRAVHRVVTPLLLFAGTQHKPRVRALVLSEQNKLLLVRSWFGYQNWSLPGGGIKKGESAIRAAMRETFEETGVLLPTSAFSLVGKFANTDSGVPFAIECYVAIETEEKPPRIIVYRRPEILEVAWFSVGQLPQNRSPLVDQALKQCMEQR